MPLSNDSFYQSFRYNNYDFENLFKAYRSLGDEIIKNFRQTEKNLFIQDLGAYRIVPRQYLNIGGAQYNTNAISSNLSSVDSKRLQNRTHPYIPSIRKQKYYNTWDTIPSDPSMFEFVSNEDGTCYISKCNAGKELNIVIPYEDSDGNIVTGVSKAFYGNTIIKSVVIPSSVLWIDEESFKGCTDLKSVSVSYGTQAIGKSAFENCLSLVEIDFPSSILEIGDKAFKNCSSLTSISLSDSLAELGSEAFSGCINLKAALIPDTISVLNDYVFANCKNLESVNTPLVTSIIGSGAFKNCFKLKDIGLHENLSEIREEAFSGCVALNNVFVPNSVTVIGDSAFMDCKGLENITLEDGNKELTIGDRAFAACKFRAISLPNRIVTIGDYALYNNSNLEFVKYPINDRLSYVSIGMFLDCANLASIFLPKQIHFINRLAFSGCNKLQTMFFDTTLRIKCFDITKVKETSVGNLEAMGLDTSLTDNIFDGTNDTIRFNVLKENLISDSDTTKEIALTILESIESYLPIDKDFFSSNSKFTGVYDKLSSDSDNDIKDYYDFIKGYDNNFAKFINFASTTEIMFSDVWPQESYSGNGEWGAILDGYSRYTAAGALFVAEFIDINTILKDGIKIPALLNTKLYIYKGSIADNTYNQDKEYIAEVVNATLAKEYKKPVIVSYEEAYPLSENAYDSSEIMSNNELCALLDASGYFIEFTASMNHEMINESAQIIGFELYDDSGRILIEGSDYAFLNNRLYLLGEYADTLLHPADTMLELRNIAIDFETVKNKIGNNLDMQYTGELSKTEFCEHVKQYTLHALLGPKISALLSALSFNSEDNENIHLYDFVNATKEIREFMNSHNLTPYDFVISSSEGIDSRKLKPLFRYVDMVKPPETNYVFYCIGEYEEVYGEISDMLGGEYSDIYDEDYANQQITGEILNLNESLEVTNTLSYVTYHTQGSSRSEAIQDELLSYQEMLSDTLYVKQGDEWVEFSIVYNGKEEFLEITEGESS